MDLNSYMARLSKAVEEGTNNATVKTAFLLERENKKLAPVDTSQLRNSIYTSVDRPRYLAEVKARTFYANYVIYGTGIYNTLGVRRSNGWYYNVTDSKSRYYGWHFTYGQRSNNFPQNAYKNQKNNIEKIIKSEISKAHSSNKFKLFITLS